MALETVYKNTEVVLTTKLTPGQKKTAKYFKCLALILATTRGIGVRTRDCLNPAEDASPLRTNNSAVRGAAFPVPTYHGVPALKWTGGIVIGSASERSRPRLSRSFKYPHSVSISPAEGDLREISITVRPSIMLEAKSDLW